MRGMFRLLGGISVAAAVAVGCASSPGAARMAAPQPPPPTRLTTTASARAQAANRPALSLAQLAGQRIVYAYSGLVPPPSLLSAVRRGEAGGVILFGPNISSPRQIGGVIAELQRAALASPLHARLLILADQEGGEVRRLPGAPLLSEKQIGARPDALAAASVAGSGAAANLASVGINVNLAPVLDVFRAPGNFIDAFQRSYSSRPGAVAALGAAFISALQRRRVAGTAKHFPGLGAATRSQNTDREPVVLTSSLATLRSVDEAPYRSAIAAGVRLVMTSWATYPALDSTRPAGLSPIVIGRELRGRLHFRGVTITDGMDAGAIARVGGLGRRGVLAAAAGADLVLCAATNPGRNTPQEGLTVMRALMRALATGRLNRASAQQAAARILALPGR
jgi:beta-N-acetylhexosaminidase